MADPIETGKNETGEYLPLLRTWAAALSAAFAGLNLASSANMARERGEPEAVVQEKLKRAKKLAEISRKLRPHSSDEEKF